MIIKALILSILLLAPTISLSAEHERTCLETATTQAEMNKCAGVGFKNADAELNRVYKKIKGIYKDDPMFLKSLRNSQRAWIKSRDANFDLEYPHADDPVYYGSIFPMCAADYKTQLTLQRVEFLKRWLVGGIEGDVCNGSKKYDWNLKEILGDEYKN